VKERGSSQSQPILAPKSAIGEAEISAAVRELEGSSVPTVEEAAAQARADMREIVSLAAARLTREVDCPRCHEICGWCSDYRWMHGKLKLPGSSRRCAVAGIEPEGDACPLCHGARKMLATTVFTPIQHTPPLGAEGTDAAPRPGRNPESPGGQP
jgi:hypothetical protein